MIPGRNAEYIINQFEIHDIGANDIILPVRMLHQSFPYPLVKKFLAVEPCKPVILNQINHGSRFPQMDDTGHPVQNHLGLVGLRNKISRAV